MGIALQPIMAAGSTAVARLPDAIKYIKRNAPKVYNEIVDITAKSKVTPEVVAQRGATNPVIAQGLVTTALRAGASPTDFIQAGMFQPGTEEQIRGLAAAYVAQVAKKAGSGTVEVPAAQHVDMAVEIRMLNQVCGILSVDPKQLMLLLTYFRTHGPEDVQAVLDFKKAAGISAY